MKRLHVHLAVNDITESVAFYTALFQDEPTILKADYAKWQLEDPRMNFAISTRGERKGLDHMGIQVEDRKELNELQVALDGMDTQVLAQGETTCCYAHSEKSWIVDPQGVAWETFLTVGESAVYGSQVDASQKLRPCCTATQSRCC